MAQLGQPLSQLLARALFGVSLIGFNEDLGRTEPFRKYRHRTLELEIAEHLVGDDAGGGTADNIRYAQLALYRAKHLGFVVTAGAERDRESRGIALFH